MENVLFLQSEMKDPFSFYDRMRLQSPLYYDDQNKIWAAYSYDVCQSILQNSSAWIPQLTEVFAGLSPTSQSIAANLARLANPPHHASTRNAAATIFQKWQPILVAPLIQQLIGEPRLPASFDWVADIARKLPVLYLLSGYGFSMQDSISLLALIDDLIKIMSPGRTGTDSIAVNRAVDELHVRLRANQLKLTPEIISSDLIASNFIGLMIQSHDAARGLLSLSLMNWLEYCKPLIPNKVNVEKCVRETLRFNSPVHNTQRQLTTDVIFQSKVIFGGSQVLVVLASANRDPRVCSNPHSFDISRKTFPFYLSFGSGHHQCIAEDFSIRLATETLSYMLTKYNNLDLVEKEVQFEPKINVRLPVRLKIKI